MIVTIRYSFVLFLYGICLITFGVIIYFHLYIQLFQSYILTNLEPTPKVFDYIVVGSGTAGSIIAYRLAQDKNNKVLLLEAGPYSNFLFDIPVVGPALQQSAIDWKYETVPQNHACRAMKNNASTWPRGKIFGGTHRLNCMIHVRGHKDDFEEWYKDNPDYNYETDILQYFGKMENWAEESSGGLMRISEIASETIVANAFLKGVQKLGFQVKDVNKEPGIGFMKPHFTLKNNKRWTTADSLLENKPNNLRILTNALATKIILKNNFEAQAIQYKHLGKINTIAAKKGTILSAGAIETPKLLLLSGIGPKKHLESVKIKPRVNLPVGENLQDHVSSGTDLVIINQTLPINAQTLMSPLLMYNYFVNGKGPWTHTGCEVIGFCRTNSSEFVHKPNLQIMVVPAGLSSDGGKHLRKTVGISDVFWDLYFSKLIEKQVINISPILLYPKSVGTIRLKDSNPKTPPLIDPKYLSHPDDVNTLIEGINLVKKIISTKPMQQIGAKLNKQVFPGCETFEFDTRDYWECYIRHITLTTYHPVGTCKMGSPKRPSSVVDYDFKVMGVNKLFVADASVIPKIIGANINAAVALIAEKAADSIKYYDYLMTALSTKIEIFVPKNICSKSFLNLG